MGNLTDDMVRLRGEVDALRLDRVALIQALSHGATDLASSVSAMRAELGLSHAAMARESKSSLAAFVSAMSRDVNALLGDCRETRSEIAIEDSNRRAVFCADLQEHVAGMCGRVADDLAGAHLVWAGRGAARSKKRAVPKTDAAVEAARLVDDLVDPVEPVRLKGRQGPASSTEIQPASTRGARGGKPMSNSARKPATRSNR